MYYCTKMYIYILSHEGLTEKPATKFIHIPKPRPFTMNIIF